MHIWPESSEGVVSQRREAAATKESNGDHERKKGEDNS
jgi:hypothetical protein